MKLLLLLILSFFSAQSFAGSCPDGSEAKYWLKKAHEHGSKIAEDICGCEF